MKSSFKKGSPQRKQGQLVIVALRTYDVHTRKVVVFGHLHLLVGTVLTKDRRHLLFGEPIGFGGSMMVCVDSAGLSSTDWSRM